MCIRDRCVCVCVCVWYFNFKKYFILKKNMKKYKENIGKYLNLIISVFKKKYFIEALF